MKCVDKIKEINLLIDDKVLQLQTKIFLEKKYKKNYLDLNIR